MRNWLRPLDEIDRDCIHQWEKLLKIKFNSYEEYSRVDELIGEMILEYETKSELKDAYPNIDTDVQDALKEREICLGCGKEIILDENEYEEIDGELYCTECVEDKFGKCDWCKEWVPHDELAYYGSILCCDDCATHDWKRLEAAHGWR